MAAVFSLNSHQRKSHISSSLEAYFSPLKNKRSLQTAPRRKEVKKILK